MNRQSIPSQSSFNPKGTVNLNTSFRNFKPKKGFLVSQEPATPKPIFGGHQRNNLGTVQAPIAQGRPQNLNLNTPLMGQSFARGFSNKKRDYSEISQDYRSAYDSKYYTFEDNSTIKPNENTIIRNPTLISMGLGQSENPQRGGKGLGIQPVNLSQNQFKHGQQDYDSESDSEYFTALKTNKQSKTSIKQETYTRQELNQMCERSSQIINQIAEVHQDPQLNDIQLINSRGKQYEFAPFSFLVTNQLKFPQGLINQINDFKDKKVEDYGLLEDIQAAYFIFDKTLILLPLSFGLGNDGIIQKHHQIGNSQPQDLPFDQVITSVTVCRSLPGMKLKDPEERLLVVALASEIRFFGIKRLMREGKFQVDKIDYKFPLDTKTTVVKFVQMKKTGRLFYGTLDGKVNELSLQESKIKSLLLGQGKKLVKVNPESQGVIKNAVSYFFNLFEDTREVIDMKIEETRNFLYVQMIQTSKNQSLSSLIEVYDLGAVGTKLRKITIIRQDQLMEKILDFQNRSYSSYDLEQMSDQYQIIYINPVTINQSGIYHLLLVTKNGLRVFISFEDDERSQNDRELYDAGGVDDFVYFPRFGNKWFVQNLMQFPSDETVDDAIDQAVHSGIFKVHNMNYSSKVMNINPRSIIYDPVNYTLVYSESNNLEQLEFNPDLHMNRNLQINFIKKNECTYAHLKYLHNLQHFEIYEHYSHLQILNQDQPRVNPYNISMFNADNFDIQDERVIEVKIVHTYASKEIEQMLGLNMINCNKGSGSPQFPYLTLSELEKQVHIQQTRIDVLTDHRVIEIQQARPVDHLVMIIHALTKPSNTSLEDFEDFMDQYSVKETCAMLVQILVDTGYFLFSRRVEDLLGHNKVKNKRQAQSQPRQNVRALGVGSKSSMYASPYGVGARQSNFSSIMPDNKTPLDYLRFNPTDAGKEFVLQACHPEIKNLALDFLVSYGDTIGQGDVMTIEEDHLFGSPQHFQQFSSKKFHILNSIDKHFALYLYTQRLLRPIWNINIIYQVDRSKPDKLALSFSSLKSIQDKLRNLQNLLTFHHQNFYGDQLKSPDGIFKNQSLYDQVVPVSELPFEYRERLETMERNSLNNLKALVTRSIDVISLLEVLTFDGNSDTFQKLMAKLSKEHKQTLRELQFQDLITTDYNPMIRKVLEYAVTVNETDTQRKFELVRITSDRIDALCKSMFTKEENQAFIGESLLLTALREKNPQRKKELMEKSIKQLCQEPTKINFSNIKSLLVEDGYFTGLADLALRKIQAYKEMKDSERAKYDQVQIEFEVDECYAIIISMLVAFDMAINKLPEEFKDHLASGGKQADNQDVQMFLRKLNTVPSKESKIDILNRVIKRIELFNDQELLLSIFDMLISKPSVNIDIDLLPHINNESFEKICDQAIAQKKIQLQKFQSLFKLLCKQQAAKRLCDLVMSVSSGWKKLYEIQFVKQEQTANDKQKKTEQKDELVETEVIIKINMQQLLHYLHSCDAVLTATQKQLDPDTYHQLQKQISQALQQCFTQIDILKNINEKFEAVKQLKGEEQLLKDLQQAREEVDTKLFDRQSLITEYIDRLGLHESKIHLLLADQDQTQMHQDQIMKSIGALVADTFDLYPNNLRQKFVEKLQFFIQDKSGRGNKQYIVTMMQLIQQELENFYKDDKSLAEDLQVLINGNSLSKTRFWLFEYCFETEELQMVPSEIIAIFSDQNGFGKKQARLRPEENLSKNLCLLKLWIRKNIQLFGYDQQDALQKRANINFVQSYKDAFQQDLAAKGSQLYHAIFREQLKKEWEDNKLVLEKEICNKLQILMDSVETDFVAMLKQHQIQLRQVQSQSHFVQSNKPQKNFLVASSIPRRPPTVGNQSLPSEEPSAFYQFSEVSPLANIPQVSNRHLDPQFAMGRPRYNTYASDWNPGLFEQP